MPVISILKTINDRICHPGRLGTTPETWACAPPLALSQVPASLLRLCTCTVRRFSRRSLTRRAQAESIAGSWPPQAQSPIKLRTAAGGGQIRLPAHRPPEPVHTPGSRDRDEASHGLQHVRGAGDGIRTRDIQLGRLALYHLSYPRRQARSPHAAFRELSPMRAADLSASIVPNPPPHIPPPPKVAVSANMLAARRARQHLERIPRTPVGRP